MPLGPDNKKPSGLNNPLVLFFDLLPELFNKFLCQVFFRLRILILTRFFLGEILRQVFRVAAKDNIGSPPGHVRGDRHPLIAAGLGNNVRL